MNTITKTTLALALGSAVLASSVTASSAANWRPWAAAGAGFVAGAAVGAAAANANAGYYYGPGYAYEPGYSYGPSVTYDSGYSGYAYEPAYPAPNYYTRGWGPCTVDEGYGRHSSCNTGN